MDKFKEIRPVVLGLAKRNNKILVREIYDKKEKKTFYRSLGGGIEFQETSEEALKREFKEELNIDITVKDFLGVFENIFAFEGKKAHEIILFYNIEIKEEDYKDSYNIIDEKEDTNVYWIDVEEFKKGNKILYPIELIKYL